MVRREAPVVVVIILIRPGLVVLETLVATLPLRVMQAVAIIGLTSRRIRLVAVAARVV
jgi:hypothetical protein